MTGAWMDRLNRRSGWALVLGLIIGALQVGCGGETTETGMTEWTPDQMEVAMLPTRATDYSNDLTRLRSAFTKEAAPSNSDREKFAKLGFDVAGEISISGDTATFPVKIIDYEKETDTTVTWKAQKVGEEWKLSEAPLN